jgi:hydrogenase maturation protease
VSSDGRRVLVMCIGNSLVADDGAGCAVHDRLAARRLPEGVRLELAGVSGIALIDRLAGEDLLIVVDAVQFGAPPGTIRVWTWADVPAARGAAVSLHGIGVREAIEVGRALCPEAMPAHVVMVGIEGACFDRLGEGLSPAVAAAVDDAAAVVERCAAHGAEARGEVWTHVGGVERGHGHEGRGFERGHPGSAGGGRPGDGGAAGCPG